MARKLDERRRVYATEVYPDSAPEGWMETVDSWHVRAFISPLHDKDFKPDGTPKKPHWHVIVFFDGKKNYETQVKPLFDAIGGVGRELIESPRVYTRYLCHLDNPEKAPYSPNDVIAFGGANYAYEILSPSDDVEQVRLMQDFICDNKIELLADFVNYCRHKNEVWYQILTDRKTYFFDKYIKSVSFARHNSEVEYVFDPKTGERIIDTETGEVLVDLTKDSVDFLNSTAIISAEAETRVQAISDVLLTEKSEKEQEVKEDD